jgi:hypothetical protein
MLAKVSLWLFVLWLAVADPQSPEALKETLACLETYIESFRPKMVVVVVCRKGSCSRCSGRRTPTR